MAARVDGASELRMFLIVGEVFLTFKEPQWTITPGQILACYKDDKGATISTPLALAFLAWFK